MHRIAIIDHNPVKTKKGNSLYSPANLVLSFACTAIAATTLHVIRHAHHLEQTANRLYADDIYKWELQCRIQALAKEVALASRRELHFEESLRDKLKACQTREDFLVRQGPWIVTSKLKSVEKQSQRVGIYLPAGGHTLKFSTNTFLHHKSEGQRASQLHTDDKPPDSTSMHSLRLEKTPEVFELHTSWVTNGGVASIQLEVLGGQNSTLLKQSQSIPADHVAVHFPLNDQLRTIAYPSELTIGDETQHALPIGHRPYTKLLVLSGTAEYGTSGTFCMWVESDAPPCVAALKVARQLEQVEQLLGIRNKQLQHNESTLFLPYDGSGRYIFRPSIFRDSSEQFNNMNR